jgi:hypothetical protein
MPEDKDKKRFQFNLIYWDPQQEVLKRVACGTIELAAQEIAKLPAEFTELAIVYGQEIPYRGKESITKVRIGGQDFLA